MRYCHLIFFGNYTSFSSDAHSYSLKDIGGTEIDLSMNAKRGSEVVFKY